MSFAIGQKVRCVDGVFMPKERFWCKVLPVCGMIYTIWDIEPGGRGLGLRLAEIVNPEIPVRRRDGTTFQFEPTFLSSRFKAIGQERIDEMLRAERALT